MAVESGAALPGAEAASCGDVARTPPSGPFAVLPEDLVAWAALAQRRTTVAARQSDSLRTKFRLYYRFARLGVHLVEGAVLAVFCGAAFVQYRRYQQPVIRWWHRRFCNILNIDVRVQGAAPVAQALWVSNHISWLDIPVLGANFPVYFLSKAEVAKWPIVGWLSRVAGTLFIRRGSGDAGQVGQQLTQHLSAGRSVLFFPEGTTTDGQRLKRFFHKLFAGAVETQLPVQPVLLCYRGADGELHAHAPFVGDDEFLSHAVQILKGGRIAVDVLVLPAVSSAGHDARSLAKEVEAKMSAALRELQEQSGSTLPAVSAKDSAV